MVHESQAAFVPGQQIHNHILLSYELLRGYNRTGGTPKCMLHMDLQKAYDTVEWTALEGILQEMSFPPCFIRWVMVCVSTVSYRYMVNGKPTRILKARRGLRQGDPLSPLLFVLVMEYMHMIMQGLKNVPDFNFHSKCERLSIVNLSFADDLLLFTRGDLRSVELVMETFESFSQSTGLRANPAKCQLYFGIVPEAVQHAIRMRTGFGTGVLPFRYLGVPLTSKKLTIVQCQPLIDKLVARIRHWSAKLLSYGGRVQLIKSVLFAVTNYWLQCFPLPKGVLHNIEAICRSFLWSNSDTVTRKSPVAWEKVCTPKRQGGTTDN